MATPVIMPRQGNTVESCIISKWHKQKGDKIKKGDVLFTYETDKAAFDEEAEVEGTLLDTFFKEGDDVPVLTNMCVIGNEGENIDEFTPKGENQTDDKGTAPNKSDDKDENTEDETKRTEEVKEGKTDSLKKIIKVSPRARAYADKIGADYKNAVPTGPNGRIIERDVKQLKEDKKLVTKAASDEYAKKDADIDGTGIGGRITTYDVKYAKGKDVKDTDTAKMYDTIPLTNIRKVIAKTMHKSLSNMAQLTLNATFDASNILEYRKAVKNNMEKLDLCNITINDIILYAVSRVLKNHRLINAHYVDDKMLLFNTVNLGVAIDTDRGLMVPTVFNAEKKSLNEISNEVKELAKMSREGSINPDLLTNGSFTVTNLGSLKIESFTPVINPPQTAILGINTIVQRIKTIDNEQKLYPAMGLSLTFDHRAVDGAPAARFLKELCEQLENFTLLLAK